MAMTDTTSKNVLEGHERFNVDVPSAKTKFMQYFYDLIEQKKMKQNLIEEDKEEPEFLIVEEQKDVDKYDRSNMELTLNEDKDGKNIDFMQKKIDDIDLTIEPIRKPSFYHYKRWLWMMFPWVCMSINKKQSFSEFINKCYSSNIRYLSVEEEDQYTKHAIKIVIEANRKKDLALGKKENEVIKTMRSTSGSNRQLRSVQSEIRPRGFLMQNQPGAKNNSISNTKSIRTLKPMAQNLTTLDIDNEKSQHQRSQITTNSKILPKTSMSLRNNNSVFSQQHAQKDSGLMLTAVADDSVKPIQEFPSQISKISQIERSEDKISQLLKKNEYWDKGIKSQTYHRDVSKILTQNMTLAGNSMESNMIQTMPKINETLMNYQMKEVNALERKKAIMVQNFNMLIDKNRQAKKQIEKLAKDEFDLVGPDPNIDIKMKHQLNDLHTDLIETERKLTRTQEQKSRTVRVIEICEINQIQNEEWIRGLNFYLSNLKKVINTEKTELKEIEDSLIEYDIVAKAFVNDFNHGIKYHSLY